MVHEHWSGDLFDERLVSDLSLSNICVRIPVGLVSIDGCQIFLYELVDVWIDVRSSCIYKCQIIMYGCVSDLPVWMCVRSSCICVW